MGMKAAGADLAFKGGLLNGNRYLAAFRAAGVEQSWGAYARILRVLADWTANGRNYRNNSVTDFVNPTSVGVAITHWGAYSALAGGDLLFDYELASALAAPAINASVGFDTNAVGWGFSSSVTQEGSLRSMDAGLVSGVRYLTIHDGAPGTTGDNAIEDPILVAEAEWSLDTSGGNRRARNNVIKSFGVAATDLPRAMYVALRSGNAANSPVLWFDEFDSQANDPDIGDILRFNVNQLSILFDID